MSQYVEEANQVLILKGRGWTEKHGLWSHPRYVSRTFKAGTVELHLYLFTFEQAIKKENLQ